MFRFRFLESYDINADQVHGRKSTHVMGEPDPGIFDLSLPGLPLKLLVHLIHHPETGCANGMPEALEPSVRLTWDLTIQVKKTVPNVISGLPTWGNSEVLVGYQLCDGETIVNLHHTDLCSRIMTVGFMVCPGGALLGSLAYVPSQSVYISSSPELSAICMDLT